MSVKTSGTTEIHFRYFKNFWSTYSSCFLSFYHPTVLLFCIMLCQNIYNLIQYPYRKKFHKLLKVYCFLLFIQSMLHIHNQLCEDFALTHVLKSAWGSSEWHLKSSGTPGRMESGQINAIMQVPWEMGTKGRGPSACSPELLARLEHHVCFCMEWQTADWPHKCYVASRSPQKHHKEPGHNLTMVGVKNALAHLLRRVRSNRV